MPKLTKAEATYLLEAIDFVRNVAGEHPMAGLTPGELNKLSEWADRVAASLDAHNHLLRRKLQAM